MDITILMVGSLLAAYWLGRCEGNDRAINKMLASHSGFVNDLLAEMPEESRREMQAASERLQPRYQRQLDACRAAKWRLF